MTAPSACQPKAFALFAEQIDDIESINGLFVAAIAISMHAVPDISPLEVERLVSHLADKVRQRVRSHNRVALIAHLHHEMFDRIGFRGNQNDYYNPNNSLVTEVLETGLGIPLSLALIYKVVATRLGLRVEGINSPGHFLVSVADSSRPMIIDPFHGGQMLTRDEAFERMDRATGRSVPRLDRFLAPATHRQWIGRMLQNLVFAYSSIGSSDDAAAMTELCNLLGTTPF